MKTTREVIQSTTVHLATLTGHVFDILTISRPVSPEAAVNLAKVVSKLSPLLGNLIEFNAVAFLNDIARYPYRLDTNFAKLNRINHPEITAFKHRVLGTTHHGKTIQEWARLLGRGSETALQKALEDDLGIREADSEDSSQ